VAAHSAHHGRRGLLVALTTAPARSTVAGANDVCRITRPPWSQALAPATAKAATQARMKALMLE